MPPLFPKFSRPCLTIALAFSLAACTSPAPPKADASSIEQRMRDIENRLDRLEARPEVKPPYRSRAEIEANIASLEAERAKLLTRYLPQHPEIRDIDRRLAILHNQLSMTE